MVIPGSLSAWNLSWGELGQAATPGVLIGIFLGVVWRYAVIPFLPLAIQTVCLVSGGIGIVLLSLFLIADDLDYAIEQKRKLGAIEGDGFVRAGVNTERPLRIGLRGRNEERRYHLGGLFDFRFGGSDVLHFPRPEDPLSKEAAREFLDTIFQDSMIQECFVLKDGTFVVYRNGMWVDLDGRECEKIPTSGHCLWSPNTGDPPRINWALLRKVLGHDVFDQKIPRELLGKGYWREPLQRALREVFPTAVVRQHGDHRLEQKEGLHTFLLFQEGYWRAVILRKGVWMEVTDDSERPCAPPTEADMPHVWAYWE